MIQGVTVHSDISCWLIGKELGALTAIQLGVAVAGAGLVLIVLLKTRGILTKVIGAGVVAGVAAWLVFAGIPWIQNQVAGETNTAVAVTTTLGTSPPKCGAPPSAPTVPAPPAPGG